MSEEKTKSKLILVLWILFTLGCISALVNAFTQGTKASSKVPLFGLTFQNQLLIFSFLWPVLLSIVCIILFPLVGIPILLKLKSKVWIKYKNGFLETGKQKFDGKKFLRRIIYLFLLTLGVNAAILGLGMFDPDLLLPGEIYYETEAQGRGYEKYPLYYPDTFIGFASIIFPLMVGLWAIGWVLEDTGLMHFKLPKENERFLYEIEPIYLKYNSFVKGYAGIS